MFKEGSFLIQLYVQTMGNKASSSLKRGGKNARPARRTSVLLQQLTEPEIRSGQLFIKEHEYLTKEIIYIDQYLENLAIDMQAYDDVQEDSDKWVEKVGKYKEECSMKTRREKSMEKAESCELVDTIVKNGCNQPHTKERDQRFRSGRYCSFAAS